MTNFIAISCFFLALPLGAHAAEPGYAEAMKYFVFRQQRDPAQNNEIKVLKGENTAQVKKPQAFRLKKQKFFLGGGTGKNGGLDFYSVQAGVAFVKTKYFQQSLYLEYKNTDTSESFDYKYGDLSNSSAQSLFVYQNLQFASTLFFLGPEIALGLGHVFDEPHKGSAVSLKAGFNFSNRWSKALLLSASINYRRDQYFSNNSDDEGVELSLRIGL